MMTTRTVVTATMTPKSHGGSPAMFCPWSSTMFGPKTKSGFGVEGAGVVVTVVVVVVVVIAGGDGVDEGGGGGGGGDSD